MNTQKRKRLYCLLAGGLLLFSVCVSGAGGQDDPLISLSYITNVVMPYIDTAVEDAAAPAFEVVELKKGQTITLGAGSEVILRSGEGTVSLAAGAAGGFTDVTAGCDISGGDMALPNHLLLCPRADGRSLYAKTMVYLMVRGPWSVA